MKIDELLRDGTTAQVEALIEAALAELKRRRALAAIMEIRPEGHEVLREVAEACAVPVEEITGRGVDPRLVAARAQVAEQLRARGWSYPRIGRLLGRDHSTVMSYMRRETVQ